LKYTEYTIREIPITVLIMSDIHTMSGVCEKIEASKLVAGEFQAIMLETAIKKKHKDAKILAIFMVVLAVMNN
jgi:hypothetical protein